MKFRLSISTAIRLFGLVTALGLCAILLTSGYAMQQLRIAYGGVRSGSAEVLGDRRT